MNDITTLERPEILEKLATTPATSVGFTTGSTDVGAVHTPSGTLDLDSVKAMLKATNGNSLQKAADDAGVSLKTLYNFMNNPHQSGTGALVALDLERKSGQAGTALKFFSQLKTNREEGHAAAIRAEAPSTGKSIA